MDEELWNVEVSGPCVSPFRSREEAESFAREFRELLARYTDAPMDVAVLNWDEVGKFGQVL